MKRISLCCCAWLIMFAGVSLRAANFTVAASGVQFVPSSLTINVGDTVTWNSLFSHTVTGDSPSDPFCGSASPPSGSCSVTFNTAGTFSYHCIPHGSFGMTGTVTVNAPAAPPSVSITNPPNNTLLAAPAAITLGVSAIDSDGTVVSVQLLTNGVAGPTDSAAPFSFTLNNLAAGNYALRARATDNQALNATSTPVNIRVVNRPTLAVTPGPDSSFVLRFNTVAGVNYVVEQSAGLTNFSAVRTNAGTGLPAEVAEMNAAPGQKFFRVRLQ